MKKSNFFKAVLSVAAAMLLSAGAFGQVQNPDYTAIVGDFDGIAIPEIDSVTTGTTTRLYVKPDSYYHPNYSATGTPAWTLTAGFNWTWVVPGAAGVTVPAVDVTTDNYVEVLWGAAAATNHRIAVTETAPPAFGGCSGDTNVYVRILATPTAAFTAGAGYISADTAVCEGDPILADLVQTTLTGVSRLQMKWTLEIATLSSLGAKDGYYTSAKVLIGAGQAFAVNRAGTLANPQEIINALTFDNDRPTGGYTAIQVGPNKKATVYTYVLNGVNDKISRKSDYLVNNAKDATLWRWYDIGPKTIVIRVNPAPVTGPIYHIPNNWAY
jgi:hypothetical protein